MGVPPAKLWQCVGSPAHTKTADGANETQELKDHVLFRTVCHLFLYTQHRSTRTGIHVGLPLCSVCFSVHSDYIKGVHFYLQIYVR